MPNKHSSNNPEAIISYWLGPPDSNPAKFDTQQKLWYHSKPETDNYIRTAFESDLASAENGDLSHWRNTAEGSLALVILLDQFSRNLYRGTPKVYANDAQALGRRCFPARKEKGIWASISQPKLFFIIPLHHAENLIVPT